LTERGRQLALGGRDPARCWDRPWDGLWRLVIFDVPLGQGVVRQRLRRTLKSLQFGFLQGSVWITPDPVSHIHSLLHPAKADAGALLIVEGRPAAGESDADLVSSAWDFDELRRRYRRYLGLVSAPLPARRQLAGWTQQEQAAWRHATVRDRFLPRRLFPRGYLGTEAFRRRRLLFAELRQHCAATRPIS
jgi:phenylacetic acid degradation operon negative regulatory protein